MEATYDEQKMTYEGINAIEISPLSKEGESMAREGDLSGLRHFFAQNPDAATQAV